MSMHSYCLYVERFISFPKFCSTNDLNFNQASKPPYLLLHSWCVLPLWSNDLVSFSGAYNKPPHMHSFLGSTNISCSIFNGKCLSSLIEPISYLKAHLKFFNFPKNQKSTLYYVCVLIVICN